MKCTQTQSLSGCGHEYRDTMLGRYLLRREVGFMSRFVGEEIQPITLVDIGCGSGYVTLALNNMGLQVVGLDINPRALAVLQQRSQNVSLIQGDVLCLPFANGSLECVVVTHCFDDLDRILFLQECNRVLDTGGLLIFDALNRHSYKWVLKRLWRCLGIRVSGGPSDKWMKILSCSEVLAATVVAGFDIQAASGYNWLPFTQGSDSVLVNVIALMEQRLRLDRYPKISPRVLIVARRRALHDSY
jgi:SAM-dependent methyltransferase